MENNLKLADYISLRNRIRKEQHDDERKLRVSLLKSYTCDMIEPILTCMLHARGYQSAIQIGGFNQFYQEILEETSTLYTFHPHMVVLLVRPEDFYPLLFEQTPQERRNVDIHVQKILDDIKMLLATIQKRQPDVNILLNTFAKPYFAPTGLYESQNSTGISAIMWRLNLGLIEIAEQMDRVCLLDVAESIATMGQSVHDIKMWTIAKNPYKFEFYEHTARQIVKSIEAIHGKRKKCIVLDLDNTLWKGIIGEDGFSGIKIYKEFQRQLLFLNQTGILLAINSKNNVDDAMAVIRHHEDMILKEEHFSALQINWDDKVSNLKKIATNLNIGLDSMVFIDDNPYECQMVEEMLPEVDVLPLPDDATKYVVALRGMWGLDYLVLTEEDQEKAQLYRRKNQAEQLKESSSDLQSFYVTLQMHMTVTEVTEHNIGRFQKRMAQLTQKTNQFNLTTRRYTEEEITGMVQAGYKLYVASLADKFGDYGIISLMIIDTQMKDCWRVDTFLLSCRVMGRTVEEALLWYITEAAAKHNIKTIIGDYIETAKNKPVKDLYKRMGFDEIATDPVYQYAYVLGKQDTKLKPIDRPKYISVQGVVGC